MVGSREAAVGANRNTGIVTSTDGTCIAYEYAGAGPAVILVGGGLDDGSENEPLVPELAQAFAVYNYARRGRGASGDTLPYAVEREIEDLAALVDEAGGAACVLGVSSGGGLALRAAAAGVAIDRLAVYEVPYCLSQEMQQRVRQYVEALGPALASGVAGQGLELFMRLAGSSGEEIAGARSSPFGPGCWRSSTRWPTTRRAWATTPCQLRCSVG